MTDDERQELIAQYARAEITVYDLAEKQACSIKDASRLTNQEMRRQMTEQAQKSNA